LKLQQNTLLALASALEFAAQPERQFTGGEVAARYRVSAHHLAKVLRTLGRAGVLEAVRGARGGYRFAANAKRLTLLDVIELFEEIGAARRPAARATRRSEGAAGAGEIEAALAVVFAEIDELARATFRSITLQTMLRLIERRRHI
jgi:Rrf2 family protein